MIKSLVASDIGKGQARVAEIAQAAKVPMFPKKEERICARLKRRGKGQKVS